MTTDSAINTNPYLLTRRHVARILSDLEARAAGLQSRGGRGPTLFPDKLGAAVRRVFADYQDFISQPDFLRVTRAEEWSRSALATIERFLHDVASGPSAELLRPVDEEPPEYDLDVAPGVSPPEPPLELTGATLHAYALGLLTWMQVAAQGLWPEETPPQVRLGDQFLIVEQGQLADIVQHLGSGLRIRQTWQYLLLHERTNWNSVEVGARRAELIGAASELLLWLSRPAETERQALGAMRSAWPRVFEAG